MSLTNDDLQQVGTYVQTHLYEWLKAQGRWMAVISTGLVMLGALMTALTVFG